MSGFGRKVIGAMRRHALPAATLLLPLLIAACKHSHIHL